MVRYLPFLLEIALLLYTLVDCLQTDERRVRNLPKLLWTVVIVLVPFLGPLAWLIGGRPPREQAGSWPLRPAAPGDDPDFLAGLGKSKAERDRDDLLRQWEDERRREQERRQADGDDADPGTR
jgi:hypothetical protein